MPPFRAFLNAQAGASVLKGQDKSYKFVPDPDGVKEFNDVNRGDLIKVGYIKGYSAFKNDPYVKKFDKHDKILEKYDQDSQYGLADVSSKEKMLESVKKYGKIDDRGRDTKHLEEKFDKVVDCLTSIIEKRMKIQPTKRLDAPSVLRENKLNSSSGFGNDGSNLNYLQNHYGESVNKINYPHLYFMNRDTFGHIMSVLLKSEVRLKSKPPRTYMGLQFDLQNIGKSLSYDFNWQFEEHYLDCFSSVGISDGDWDEFMQKYIKKKIITWDGENYDRSLAAKLLWVCCRIRQHFMESEYDKEMLELYYEEIINKLCVCPNGDVFAIFNGNPSGHCNTTIDNVMCNMAIFAYCWLYEHDDLNEFPDFIEKSGWTCYGDDGYSALLDEYKDFFVKVCKKYWKKLNGLNCVYQVFDNYLQADFLGRKAVIIKGKHYPIKADPARTVTNFVMKFKKNKLTGYHEFERVSALWLEIFPSIYDPNEIAFARDLYFNVVKPCINSIPESGVTKYQCLRNFFTKTVPLKYGITDGSWIKKLQPVSVSFQSLRSQVRIESPSVKMTKSFAEWKKEKEGSPRYANLTSKQWRDRYDTYKQQEEYSHKNHEVKQKINREVRVINADTVSDGMSNRQKQYYEAHKKSLLQKDAMADVAAASSLNYGVSKKAFEKGLNQVGDQNTDVIPIEYEQTFSIKTFTANGNQYAAIIFQNSLSKFHNTGMVDATGAISFDPTFWQSVLQYDQWTDLYNMFNATAVHVKIMPTSEAFELAGTITAFQLYPGDDLLHGDIAGSTFKNIKNSKVTRGVQSATNNMQFLGTEAFEYRDIVVRKPDGNFCGNQEQSSNLDYSSTRIASFANQDTATRPPSFGLTNAEFDQLNELSMPPGCSIPGFYIEAPGTDTLDFEITIYAQFSATLKKKAYSPIYQQPKSVKTADPDTVIDKIGDFIGMNSSEINQIGNVAMDVLGTLGTAALTFL